MKKTLLAAALMLVAFGTWSGPLEFDQFIKLDRGMNEGQVLQIAGPPDYITVESHWPVLVKSYYYLGDRAEPFTTRIIFSGGTVISIERDKVFF